MESFLAFVHEWGYVAVFLGAIVEGESVILTASAMAAMGYLSLYKVMAITFCTTVVVDQILYYLGRSYGPAFFERFPKLRDKVDRAFRLLHSYDLLFILAFRFIYGIRVISPIVIGAANISPRRFSPLNVISAALWTTVSCYTGYMLGDVIEKNLKVVKHYALLGLVVAVLIAVAYYLWKRYKKDKVN